MNPAQYRRVYDSILQKRDTMLKENKELLDKGDKFKYTCNCNFLRGISYAIQRLPRPSNDSNQ